MTTVALVFDTPPESATDFAEWFRVIADKIESGEITPVSLSVQPDFESDRHFGPWSPGGTVTFEYRSGKR